MIERRSFRAAKDAAVPLSDGRRPRDRAPSGPETPDAPAAAVFIAAVTHDLVRRRSIVSLQWKDDPEKKVAVPVPFGCALDVLEHEAAAALQALSAEIAGLRIVPPADAPGAPILT